MDYKTIHDESCFLLQYIENFLKPDSPVEQIHEEIKRHMMEVAESEHRLLRQCTR